jgi:hypothetical protein
VHAHAAPARRTFGADRLLKPGKADNLDGAPAQRVPILVALRRGGHQVGALGLGQLRVVRAAVGLGVRLDGLPLVCIWHTETQLSRLCSSPRLARASRVRHTLLHTRDTEVQARKGGKRERVAALHAASASASCHPRLRNNWQPARPRRLRAAASAHSTNAAAAGARCSCLVLAAAGVLGDAHLARAIVQSWQHCEPGRRAQRGKPRLPRTRGCQPGVRPVAPQPAPRACSAEAKPASTTALMQAPPAGACRQPRPRAAL